jgi:serine/threonine-protein kinase
LVTSNHGHDARLGLTLDGRYRVVERVAAGGMGVVYRGERVGLAKPVAIKFLHRSAALAADRRQRFEREAAAMSRLSHPNLASIIDYGTYDDVPYLVMEYHPGATLKKLIAGGALPAQRAVYIGRQILAGLASAHAAGVVHRDLKPANVLIVGKPGEDLVKILDFGMAKLLEGDGRPSELSVMAGTVLGTAEYMAPEQVKVESIDARADLYAVGILLYEMLTGAPPFVAERDLAVLAKQVGDAPVSPRKAAPWVSEALEAVVLRALQKKREDRWQSSEEFQAALLRTAEGRAASPGGGGAAENDVSASLRIPIERAPTIVRQPGSAPPESPWSAGPTSAGSAFPRFAAADADAPTAQSRAAPVSRGTRVARWVVAFVLLFAIGWAAAWIADARGLISFKLPF